MISYVYDNNLFMLENFLNGQKNIYACRISCLLKSYGLNYDFASFHIQTDDSGNVTAAFGKYYSDMTLCLTENSDTGELSEFISFSGFSSLLCGKTLPIVNTYESGTVMELKVSATEQILPQGTVFDFSPPLKDLWTLLKSCEGEDFAVPEYEDFLIDTSHKLRHDTAHCIAAKSGKQFISAAMTVAESDYCAVIGAVATDKNFRKCGSGSACVAELCGRLRNKTVFIMRDENKNEKFYASLGFENTGKFYIYR